MKWATALRSADPSAGRGEAGPRAARKMDGVHSQWWEVDGSFEPVLGVVIRAVNVNGDQHPALGWLERSQIWEKDRLNRRESPRCGAVENKNAPMGIAITAMIPVKTHVSTPVENKNAPMGIAMAMGAQTHSPSKYAVENKNAPMGIAIHAYEATPMFPSRL